MSQSKPAIELRTFIDEDQYRKDVSFSEHNMDDAFQSQASLYAHYASLAHKAQYQADRCKQNIEIIAAQIDMKVRNDWDVKASGKITERAVETQVLTTAKYILAQRRYHKARMIAGLCREAAEAFKHRKDMLQQVGAAHREERKGQLRMREQEDALEKREALKVRALEVVRENRQAT